ncbi:unnamed protein product [Phyllotreta striolata]|uniref:Uncharacterized protein n=1 Tax=Phyllotreta striolata TaxID=444603 RepID=A0A9N9TP01_PHYSR|nr:unnamed protein product [Phyllotreta striolata]
MRVPALLCACLALAQCRVLTKSELFERIKCDRTDPAFDGCLLDAVRASLPDWMDGVPDLGIPPLDPLVLDSFRFDPVANPAVNFTLNLRNVRVTGLRGLIVDGLKVDPNNMSGRVKVRLPHIEMVSDYDVKGRFGMMEVDDSGHLEGEFDDIKIAAKGNLKPYKQDDGRTYLKVNKLRLDITMGNANMKVASKNKDFQSTIDMGLELFNRNAAQMLGRANAMFGEQAAMYAKRMADEVLSKLPLPDQML